MLKLGSKEADQKRFDMFRNKTEQHARKFSITACKYDQF